MAIIVTCPGCHKSFSVRDEFAGRTGPCPKCKTPIKIPKAGESVKIHGGEAFDGGGRSVSGELVLKPLKRKEEKFSPRITLQIVGGTLVLFLLTWLLGGIFRSSAILRCLGLILITPPLVYAPYFFLKDTEAIENLSGRELQTRALICSGVYLALWAGFGIVSHFATGAFGGDLWVWFAVASPFAVVGSLLGSAIFELETGDGVIHFMFYLIVTATLCFLAGVQNIVFKAAEISASSSGANIPLDPR
ncbi:MAG: hypothetical protein Q4D98_11210 [Planctomycetia bacterium]|nr:hypothetical protein [Planctomycetia bacterium]